MPTNIPPTIAPRIKEIFDRTGAKAVDNPRNNYEYSSGWGGGFLMGQQYRFNTSETRKLTAALSATFTNPAELEIAIEQLHVLMSEDKNIGSIAFTSVQAADLMTQFARQNGVGKNFGASITPPTHPVG